MQRTLVIIESPFFVKPGEGRTINENIDYALECLRDSVNRGETPFASHLLYTMITNDCIPSERELGISMGLQWGKHAEKTVVYTDYGISPGMELGIKDAIENKRIIEYRKIL